MAVELAVKDRLEKIADYTISISTPTVDTGAYITSFSYNVGSGRPRGKSSEGRPRVGELGKDTMREEGYQNLASDISRINFKKMSGSLTLSNGAPHAGIVDLNYNISGVLENLYG